MTVGLRRLRPAAPAIERGSVWMDTVRRGPMVREVLGQGTLVPEEIRWIAARTNARVERVLVKPGARVQPDTVLVELANTDVQLAALEADRELAQAQAQLANLEASLNAQQLAQESVIATLGSEHGEASRRARADEELSGKGFISELDLAQSREKAKELGGRLSFEQKRLGAQGKGMAAQISAQRAQIQRMRSIAEFRRQEVEALKVRAGVEGRAAGAGAAAGAVGGRGGAAGQGGPARSAAGRGAHPRDPGQGRAHRPEGHRWTPATAWCRRGWRASIPPPRPGTVRVDLALEGALPDGARPDLNVEGTIEIERLPSVLYVGRPAFGQPEGTVGLFRVEPDGHVAARTPVKLGRSSVKNVEIRDGLKEGDQVILSDMSEWDHVDRVRIP